MTNKMFSSCVDIIGDDGTPLFFANITYVFRTVFWESNSMMPVQLHGEVGTVRLLSDKRRPQGGRTITTWEALMSHPDIHEVFPW